MSTALTLKIPDHIYKPLLRTSALIGKTPEQIVSEWIEKMINRLDDDPLLQLAGVFECNISNVSDAHDEYIGQRDCFSANWRIAMTFLSHVT